MDKFKNEDGRDLSVVLIGNDGNAFSIIGACTTAAKRAKIPKVQIDKFCDEAMSSGYDHLLRTCAKYFEVI